MLYFKIMLFLTSNVLTHAGAMVNDFLIWLLNVWWSFKAVIEQQHHFVYHVFQTCSVGSCQEFSNFILILSNFLSQNGQVSNYLPSWDQVGIANCWPEFCSLWQPYHIMVTMPSKSLQLISQTFSVMLQYSLENYEVCCCYGCYYSIKMYIALFITISLDDSNLGNNDLPN